MKNFCIKLFPFLISLLFAFPILKENYSSIGVLLLLLFIVIYKISSKELPSITVKSAMLTLPFWLLFVYSSIHGGISKNVIHIEHGLFFLVIPLLFEQIPKYYFSEKWISIYLMVLKNICLLIAIIYVLSFFLNNPIWKFQMAFYNDSFFRNYIYSDFKLFVIHPTYYTSFLILMVAHSFEMVLKQKKYFQLVYIVTFFLITFFLLTKLNMVIMGFVSAYIILFRNNFGLKTKFLLLIFSISFIGSLILYVPGVNKRFSELYENLDTKPNALAFNSTNVRKAIFDCDISLIKQNWVVGVGFKNLQYELNNCYKSNYKSSFFEHETYMTHNYYFYILISCGIIGFLVYLIYLINIIIICFKSNLFLFKVFLFGTLSICLVEDYFYRHYGVLYFNLILMTFINHYRYNLIKKDIRLD